MIKTPDGVILDAIQVDRDSKILLYQQIFNGICDLILSGSLVSGTRLPSTRVLMQELKVSRNTVRQAFEQLISEGYLQGQDGSGTYVAPDIPDASFQLHRLSERTPVKNHSPVASLSSRGRKIAGDFISQGFSKGRAFAPSLPALDLFPVKNWTRILSRQWGRRDLLRQGYGELAGYRPLREAVAFYLQSTRGVVCEWEQVIIVSGAQQAFHLLINILLDPGDSVWVEEPGNLGLRSIILSAGAVPAPVPVDESGLNVKEGIALHANARVAIIAPSHQYPLGVTMPLSRRLEMLEWAYKTNGWVIEDDYDSEFRYSGKPVSALQSLDRHEKVIYVGTFTKVLSPALRIGYLVVPKGLIKPLTNAIGISTRGLPTHIQAALTDFILEGYLATHIRRMRKISMERQHALLDAVSQQCDGLLDVAPTNSGLHLVGWLPEGIDDVAAYRLAKSRGVETYPLSRYYENPLAQKKGLMMGFACAPPEEITRATGILASALREVSNIKIG